MFDSFRMEDDFLELAEILFCHKEETFGDSVKTDVFPFIGDKIIICR